MESVDNEGRADVIEIIDAENTQNKQNNFLCDICSNTFRSSRSLAAHRRYHKGYSKSSVSLNQGRI